LISSITPVMIKSASNPGGLPSEDDQIVPFADAGPLAAKLLKNGTLKVYKGLPHGMPTTHAAQINADLLEFIKS
jgi:non-heme chloroperoxidase